MQFGAFCVAYCCPLLLCSPPLSFVTKTNFFTSFPVHKGFYLSPLFYLFLYDRLVTVELTELFSLKLPLTFSLLFKAVSLHSFLNRPPSFNTQYSSKFLSSHIRLLYSLCFSSIRHTQGSAGQCYESYTASLMQLGALSGAYCCPLLLLSPPSRLPQNLRSLCVSPQIVLSTALSSITSSKNRLVIVKLTGDLSIVISNCIL